MVKVTYVSLPPEELKEIVSKSPNMLHEGVRAVVREYDDRITLVNTKVITGLNKVSGKRFYRFKTASFYSYKIKEFHGKKYLYSYHASYGPDARKKNSRRFSEHNPAYAPSVVKFKIFDMCKRLIGDPIVSSDVGTSLTYYWKPLIYNAEDTFSVSRYKELRGISPRSSSVEDFSNKLFGRSDSELVNLLSSRIWLESVVTSALSTKHLLNSKGLDVEKYARFLERVSRRFVRNDGLHLLALNSLDIDDATTIVNNVDNDPRLLDFLVSLGNCIHQDNSFIDLVGYIDFNNSSQKLYESLSSLLDMRKYFPKWEGKTLGDFSEYGYYIPSSIHGVGEFIVNKSVADYISSVAKGSVCIKSIRGRPALLIKSNNNDDITGFYSDGSSVEESDISNIKYELSILPT